MVLAFSPSYDSIRNEEDEKVIEKSLERNLVLDDYRFNWFNYKKNLKRNTSGHRFWSDTFRGIYKSEKDGKILSDE